MLPCMEPPEVGPSGHSGWPMDGQVGSLQASEAVDQRPDQDFCSALGGIRTPNLLIRSQMLYPLSYERLGASLGSRSPGPHQYVATGRISMAPPRRAAGMRAATATAPSRSSASRTKYPPTAPLTSTYGPSVATGSPPSTRTVVACSGRPSGSPGV